ncbi:MAG: neutral/alkaline non-lysosomal ceramidase N-terminal domain-containing protein [Pirellulales bacterium]
MFRIPPHGLHVPCHVSSDSCQSLPGGVLLPLLLIPLLLPVSSARAAPIEAGVARIDLTPPLKLKASLGGYGSRMSRPAEGVHDRVFAKALVLGDGTRRFALVTADLLGFPPPVKQAVVAELAADGWSSEQIMLLPSHSHTSIDMMQINPNNKLPIPQLGIFRKPVYEWTVGRLVEVIREASRHPVPIRVGTARTELVGWNANRRRKTGATDNELTLTRIDTRDGRPLAVLVNWTAHPTIMSGEDMWFSAGWPGHLQRTFEALVGQGVTVMYYNGAQGDQRPVTRDDSGSSRWERAERYGRELAIVSDRLYRSIEPADVETFAYHLEKIELPEAAPHSQFMQTGGAEYGLTAALMGRLLATIIPAETSSGSLRLGELVIVGVPGELTASLGLEVKRQAETMTGARFATIGGLANEWVSYILPRAEYERGGYEASVSFYGPSLGEAIEQGVLAGVKELGPAE